MQFEIRLQLARQRIIENQLVVHSGLLLLAIGAFALYLLGRRKRAIRLFSQIHRTARPHWMRRLVEPYIVANLGIIHTDSVFSAEVDLRGSFGNRIMVLKAPGENREKGVLFVMVSYMFDLLYAQMDIQRLLEDYTLVFEPSWSGYCFPGLLQYTRWNHDVFVLSAEEGDFSFLERLGSNLLPVDLGPCDWVDPDISQPHLEDRKEFDILMNSNWATWKRHYVLFQMLQRSKRRYKVALIGQEWGNHQRTYGDIERLANFYGVGDQITIFDNIPYRRASEITCKSRMSILLSLKEGSNRAIAESILCNVPVIVLSNHVGGIRKRVVLETGVFAEECRLESSITQLLQARINPRTWGMSNVSCFKSSEKLNKILRDRALCQGRPWTRDIAVRCNSPDSVFKYPDDAQRLSRWNDGLKDYLR